MWFDHRPKRVEILEASSKLATDLLGRGFKPKIFDKSVYLSSLAF